MPNKYQTTVEAIVDDTIKMTIETAQRFGEEGVELAHDVANFVDTIRRQLRGNDALQALESIWVGAELKLAALADEAAKAYLGNILSIGLRFAAAIGGNVLSDIGKSKDRSKR